MSVEAVPSCSNVINPSTADQAANMQALVDSILARFDQACIPYCLLRNRDRIPWGLLSWSDLDVLVPGDISRRRLIGLLADLAPSQVVDVRPGLLTFSFPVSEIYLRVDICCGNLDWRGAPYAIASEILANRWNDDGIVVASELHQAYVTWISKLIWSGYFGDRYEPLIRKVVREFQRDCYALLERAFGPELARRLIDLALTNRLPESEALIPQLRRSLWWRAFRRDPLQMVQASLAQLIDRGRTLARPTGLVVEVTGPDGVGKTTVCDQITHGTARYLPCGRVDHLTSERRVLPALADLKTRHRLPSDPVPSDIQSRVSGNRPGPLETTCIAAYDTLNRWLSHLRWTRYRLTRGRLVLDDSQPAIRPAQYPTTTLDRLRSRIERLGPQPDLTIVLDAPANILEFRPPYQSPDSISAQRDAALGLVRQRPHSAVVVNAVQPLDVVVADVRRHIIRAFEERSRRRYPELIR